MLELEPPPDDPPELPPLGMLELLPPELPEEPEDPDEPEELDDEPPEEGLGMLEGMLDEEEDCCAQPPMRKAETEPTSAVWTAMTRSRRTVGLWDIAFSPVRVRSPDALSLDHQSHYRCASRGEHPESATAKLNAR